MQVNEPVTSIVTERPIFTNIDNGIGLFGSKYSRTLTTFMSNGTVLENLWSKNRKRANSLHHQNK